MPFGPHTCQAFAEPFRARQASFTTKSARVLATMIHQGFAARL